MEVRTDSVTDVFNNYNTENVSKYISKYTHKYKEEVRYHSNYMKVTKFFKDIKQAKRHIDLLCIKNNKPQIYDTFKAK